MRANKKQSKKERKVVDSIEVNCELGVAAAGGRNEGQLNSKHKIIVAFYCWQTD